MAVRAAAIGYLGATNPPISVLISYINLCQQKPGCDIHVLLLVFLPIERKTVFCTAEYNCFMLNQRVFFFICVALFETRVPLFSCLLKKTHVNALLDIGAE